MVTLMWHKLLCSLIALPLMLCVMIFLSPSEVSAQTPGAEAVCLAEQEDAPVQTAQKATVEDGENDWTLYACIGGGVLVFAAVVGILAGGKKK